MTSKELIDLVLGGMGVQEALDEIVSSETTVSSSLAGKPKPMGMVKNTRTKKKPKKNEFPQYEGAPQYGDSVDEDFEAASPSRRWYEYDLTPLPKNDPEILFTKEPDFKAFCIENSVSVDFTDVPLLQNLYRNWVLDQLVKTI